MRANSLQNHAFLSLGFRPFFLLGAAYAAITILLWVSSLYFGQNLNEPWTNPMLWHGHEMIFGYVGAIVAGFLLTAVANWTGQPPTKGIHLFALVLLWLAGRIVMNMSGLLPAWLVTTIDTAFFPAIALTLAIPLWRAKNKRNALFLVILTTLFACNLLIHLKASHTALYAAFTLILMINSLIGGRIIPFFTTAALKRIGKDLPQAHQPKTDIAALLSFTTLVAAVFFLKIHSPITGTIALTTALIHLYRMRLWHLKHIWHDPMIWILHISYTWLVIGLILLALIGFSIIPPHLSTTFLHTQMLGAIGGMTLGMICRVAQGHTGRPLIASKTMTLCFISLQLATLLRVIGPSTLPQYTSFWVTTSAIIWSLIFTTYVINYTKILWSPREA